MRRWYASVDVCYTAPTQQSAVGTNPSINYRTGLRKYLTSCVRIVAISLQLMLRQTISGLTRSECSRTAPDDEFRVRSCIVPGEFRISEVRRELPDGFRQLASNQPNICGAFSMLSKTNGPGP